MHSDVVVLVTENDDSRFSLINKTLARVGIDNEIIQFKNGKAILDFLFSDEQSETCSKDKSYIILLDVEIPEVDGIEVLRRIKNDKELCKIPVIIFTTADKPGYVDACHSLGCCIYISKPAEYDRFTDAVKKIGTFLSVAQIPQIS